MAPLFLTEVTKGKPMRLSKRQLKQIVREEYTRLKRQGLITEYGTGAEFDHLRSEKDNLTDEDMAEIANRFCTFLRQQEFPYATIVDAYHNTDDGTFSPTSETISVRVNVRTNTWKQVRIVDEDWYGRRRVRYSDQPVYFLEHGFRGFNLSKLFAGTKYLQYMKPHLRHGQVGGDIGRYTFTMLLFWPKYDEVEERKLIYQELKEWLGANENKSFDRDDFGLPPIKQEYK